MTTAERTDNLLAASRRHTRLGTYQALIDAWCRIHVEERMHLYDGTKILNRLNNLAIALAESKSRGRELAGV